MHNNIIGHITLLPNVHVCVTVGCPAAQQTHHISAKIVDLMYMYELMLARNVPLNIEVLQQYIM